MSTAQIFGKNSRTQKCHKSRGAYVLVAGDDSLPISQDMARSAKLRLTVQVFLSSRAYVGKMLWYSSLLILDIIGAGGLIIGVIALLHRATSRRVERF